MYRTLLFRLLHLVHALMARATRCSNGFELDPGVAVRFSEGTFIVLMFARGRRLSRLR